MTSPSQGVGARVKGLVRPIFAISAAVFVILVVKDMATRFDGLTVSFKWGWVALAVLPACAAVLFQYQAWWELVAKWAGKRMPRLLSLRVYVDGQMARYTPGKVGLPAVRVAGAGPLGVSAQIMIGTLLAEVLAWSACGAILGGLLIATHRGSPGESGLVARAFGGVGVGATLGLLLLMTVPTRVWPKKIVALLGSTGQGTLIPWQVPAWQMLHFCCSAISGLFLVVSVGGSPLDGLYLGAVLCVAIVAGFLALLAPAGVGVREAVLAVFAEPVLGTSAAVALGLIARAVSLTAELSLFFLMRALSSRLAAPRSSSD